MSDFYKWIYCLENQKNYPFRVAVYDGERMFNVGSFKDLATALWERDLFLEYDGDYESIVEDTRPNPYTGMVLPSWPSKRVRGRKCGGANYDMEGKVKRKLDHVKQVFLEYPYLNQSDLCQCSGLNHNTLRKYLNWVGLTYEGFKSFCLCDGDVYSLEFNKGV